MQQWYIQWLELIANQEKKKPQRVLCKIHVEKNKKRNNTLDKSIIWSLINVMLSALSSILFYFLINRVHSSDIIYSFLFIFIFFSYSASLAKLEMINMQFWKLNEKNWIDFAPASCMILFIIFFYWYVEHVHRVWTLASHFQMHTTIQAYTRSNETKSSIIFMLKNFSSLKIVSLCVCAACYVKDNLLKMCMQWTSIKCDALYVQFLRDTYIEWG